MLENQDMSAPIKLAEGYNPFGDEDFAPQVQTQVEVAPTATTNEPNNDTQSAQTNEGNVDQTPSVDTTPTAPTFDPNEFVKERFGFESVEQAEQEIRRLKETPSFEFKDDISKTLFDAIREGKADDVYEVLNQQKRLEKLTTSELTPEIAAEIVKTNMKSKHKELTSEDVDLLYYDQFLYL